VKDCNGEFIPLKRRKPSSLMAEAAQAAEVELLLTAIRLAKTTKEFQITLIQHDGFSVEFRKNKDVWRGRIDKAIAAKAEEMEIPTGLEWEET
jgi:negative regulator of sigma E activity